MKNLVIKTTILLMLFQFCQINGIAQNENLEGNWTGIFMGQFKMNISLTNSGANTYSGKVQMFADQQQIQNDELTKIVLAGNDLSFFIAVKDTKFEGVVDIISQQISGNFIFPDGSKHPVLVERSKYKTAINNTSTVNLLTTRLSVTEMQSDLQFMTHKLTELHPQAYKYVSEAELNNILETTMESFDNEESIVEFYSQIVAIPDAIGCSHTGIRLPKQLTNALQNKAIYFPAEIYFQDNKAWFIKAVNDNLPIPAGAQVVSINGMKIPDIINQMLRYFPSEGHNLTTKFNQMNRNFVDYFVLIEYTESFELEYIEPDNKEIRKEKLLAVTYQEINKLYAPQHKVLKRDFPVDFELLPEINSALLTIESFNIRDVNLYISYMDSMFNLLDTKNIQNLLIDLRDNSGGHPIFAAQLFSYLTDKPFVYFDSTTSKVQEFAPLYAKLQPNQIHFNGTCFVLVNGGCLSTTGHFISLLKYYQSGIFIGEEPGSTFECNDNSKQFVLPFSRIELNVPVKVFRTAVDDFFVKQPTIVDIPVIIEADDVVAEKDKYLEVAYKQIQKTDKIN